MSLPIADAPEPRTEAYYEANQNHLCTFLLALAKGYRIAKTQGGTPIPANVWKDRRAAVIMIDDTPEKTHIRESFGEALAGPISIEMDRSFRSDVVNRQMGVTAADIEILRRYYHVTLQPERSWHTRKIVRDFNALFARTPGPDAAPAHA